MASMVASSGFGIGMHGSSKQLSAAFARSQTSRSAQGHVLRLLPARRPSCSLLRPAASSSSASSPSSLSGSSFGSSSSSSSACRSNEQHERSSAIKTEAYSADQRLGGNTTFTPDDDSEDSKKRAMVSKRLEDTARYFKRLGSLGFWTQLVCSVVAAVILAFSVVISGQATAPITTYLTSAGIAAAFLSTFWSFGYMRLANRLRSVQNTPSKAPPRASVVDNLKNGIIINILGMGATLLGFLATVGVLVAKALTSSYQPFGQGVPAGYSPVMALDVFLIQASANALLSHFFGLVFSLELLRALTLQQPPPENVIPKPA